KGLQGWRGGCAGSRGNGGGRLHEGGIFFVCEEVLVGEVLIMLPIALLVDEGIRGNQMQKIVECLR
ncbi:hypothetical protein A2U01_0041808, partial [Trifolium medium]|nr:hypothetical protein [Trifolium medium]